MNPIEFWNYDTTNPIKLKVDPSVFFAKKDMDFGADVYEKITALIEIEGRAGFQKIHADLKAVYLLNLFAISSFLKHPLNFIYHHRDKLPLLPESMRIIGEPRGELVFKQIQTFWEGQEPNDLLDYLEFEKKYTSFQNELADKYADLHIIFHTPGVFQNVYDRILQNPDQYLTNLSGESIGLGWQTFEVIHKNGRKEQYSLKNGKKEGSHVFFLDEKKQKEQVYENNKKVREISYHKDGLTVSKIVSTPNDSSIFEIETYYENGNLKKKYTEDKSTVPRRKIGEEKEYYENGQLKKKTTHLGKNEFEFEEYYENGQIMATGGKGKIFTNFWDKEGRQTVTDGNGSYLKISYLKNDIYEKRGGVKNGLHEGELVSYKNKILTGKEIYENGINTKVFYYFSNGTIKEILTKSEGRFSTEIYNENGILKSSNSNIGTEGNWKHFITYSDDGKNIVQLIQKDESYSLSENAISEKQTWYFPNGNTRTYHERFYKGNRHVEKSYYENGQLQKEIRYDINENYVEFSYWNEAGEQTLKKGQGFIENKINGRRQKSIYEKFKCVESLIWFYDLNQEDESKNDFLRTYSINSYSEQKITLYKGDFFLEKYFGSGYNNLLKTVTNEGQSGGTLIITYFDDGQSPKTKTESHPVTVDTPDGVAVVKKYEYNKEGEIIRIIETDKNGEEL